MYYIEPSTRRALLIGGAGMLVVIAGVFAVTTLTGDAESASTLPKELSVTALKAEAANPRQAMERVREAFNREDLTDEQRQELRTNMREVWRSAMQERLNEYFAASPEQQVVILDRQIDEMLEGRQRREAERANRQGPEGQRANRGQGDNQAQPTDGQRRGRGSWSRGDRPRPTQQERKQRSEARNPDETAQRMAYYTAMRARMQERGIEMRGRGGR